MKALKTLMIVLLCLVGLFLILGLTSSNVPWGHKQSENETGALSTMRMIRRGQEVYYQSYGMFLSSVQAFIDTDLLDQDILLNSSENGYIFTVKLVSPDVWEATAAPVIPGETGKRWFFTNSLDGELRMKYYGPADSNSYSFDTDKGNANGPGFIDRWVYEESLFFTGLVMAFRSGIAAFCVFVLYMFLKVLGVGEQKDR